MSPKRIENRTNHSFTWKYRQPDDYHFCLDSILLAEFAAEKLRSLFPRGLRPDFRALDLCSGCGVIGLELAHLYPEISEVDFLEIQSEFRPYFERNREMLGRSEGKFRFINANYDKLHSVTERYDLIVSNPPYFSVTEGKLTENSLKNRCRFFLDSDFETLIDAIISVLKPNGVAFILVKSGENHGRNLVRDIALHLMGRANAQVVCDIRGTLVLELHFNA